MPAPVNKFATATRHVAAYNGEPVSRVPVIQTPLVTTLNAIATAGAHTYTPAQMLQRLIERDPNGAARDDVTPTAALMVAAVPGAFVGQSFDVFLKNTADANETVTVTAGTGATLSGTMTIAQNNVRRFLLVLTNVTVGSEAYTLYSLGANAF